MEEENRFILRVKDADGNWIEIPGIQGKAAGFGETSAEISMLPAGRDPTVSVEASGPDTAKEFSFAFGIPEVDTTDVEAATAAANAAASSAAATEAAVEAAEALRVTAETARVSAETARVSAESARVSAETSRASAETARASAESARETAEDARETAETARASAESARETAEDARETAETARENAETERAAEFAGWEETIDSKADQTALTAEITRATAAETEIAADVSSHTQQIANLQMGKADKTALAKTDKRLEYLYALTRGQSWDITTDTTSAYQKTVPAGAVAVGIASIGGHAEMVEGEIISVDITGIVSKNSEQTGIGEIQIPDELKTYLSDKGYGLSASASIYNYIDFTEKKYYQNVKMIDLGDLSWYSYSNSYPRLWYANISGRVPSSACVTLPPITGTNFYGYQVRTTWNGIRDNAGVCKYAVNESYPRRLWINDANLSGKTRAEVAQYFAGKKMIYKLETPSEFDISSYLPEDFDNLLDAEAGGTVTFEQVDTEFEVPNSTDFYIKLEEAITA